MPTADFDPGSLVFELLALSAATQPAEHDLFKKAPATVIVSTAEEPATSDDSVSVAFADPVAHLSPLSADADEQQAQEISDEPDAESEPKPADDSGTALQATDEADENVAEKPDPQDSWRPLKFDRPALRGGSRHELKSLPFNRPSLRAGAREAVRPSETAETEPAVIAAVVRAIEEDIDSQAFEAARETPTTKPMRRPVLAAAVSMPVEGRPSPVPTKTKAKTGKGGGRGSGAKDHDCNRRIAGKLISGGNHCRGDSFAACNKAADRRPGAEPAGDQPDWGLRQAKLSPGPCPAANRAVPKSVCRRRL